MESVILSVVMNMRQNEEIKRKLNYFLIVLLVILAVLWVGTIRNGKYSVRVPLDAAEEPGREDAPAENEAAQTAEDVPAEQQDELTAQADAIMHPYSDTDMEDETGDATSTSYILKNVDGYIQVYISETEELFMETTIAYELLPKQVQEQIDEGKYFDSEEALFGFLENYSS